MSQQHPYGGQGTHGPWGAGINQSQGIPYSGAPPGVEFPMYFGYPGAGCRFGGYGGWEVAIPNRLTAVQEGIRVMSDGDLPTATIRV
ncbi:hypothetical protein B0W44_11325 [Novibacillus thermophilus]|uniref:Uncharacterized protein n=1 Tax=Novibacillus thermophilus TaxID=1471761 RepID=A0A1U9K8B8_9BACL|nr:hypothetical protein B0W44_11325 [Novibacillus thermophilus]